jgi:KRAB domain-containing zinc finger protein
MATMQQHLRNCIKSEWELKVILPRLTDEQLLALKKSADPSSRECQLCGDHCTNAENLRLHVDSHSTPTAGEIKCNFDQCTLIFSSSTELKQHMKTHFVFSRISCHFCGRIFCRKTNLKVHIRQHIGERSYACDFPGCSFSAFSSDRLLVHKKMVHSAILYTCLLCGKDIKTISCYKSHVAKHNTERPGIYKCIVGHCKKLFKAGDELKKHLKKVHAQVQEVQCNECGKCFFSKQRLTKHLLSVCNPAKRPFKCTIQNCTYSTKVLKYLNNHTNNVHSSVRFTCYHCDKRLKREDRFKIHMKNHETDTPGVFKCLRMGCTMTFTETVELRKHIMDTHEGIKRYSCHICGQSNTSSSHLNRHILRKHHNGKMTCMIPGCWYTCENSQQMEIHRKTGHASFVFTSCHLCGKEYYSETLFQKHVKAHKTKKEGVFKCLEWKCKKTFSVPLKLMAHMKQHCGVDKKCKIANCSFTSPTNGELLIHMSYMHSIWQYTCKFCDKGFDKLGNLRGHEKRHTAGKSGVMKCSLCIHTCKSAAELKKHVKEIHFKALMGENNSVSNQESNKNDESPIAEHEERDESESTALQQQELKQETDPLSIFECAYENCKQTFISAADLEKHAAWHLSPRQQFPFACDNSGCKYRCNTERALISHKRRMHITDLWTCHFCGKQYINSYYGLEHVKTAHKVQQDPNVTSLGSKTAVEQPAPAFKHEIEEVVFD